MTRDSYVGIGILAFAVLYWLEASTIPTSFLDTSVPASAIPKTLAVAMGFLALMLILQSVVAKRRNAPPKAAADGSKELGWHAHKRAAGMLAIGIAYLFLLSTLGYAISVALLLAAVAIYNGKRAPGTLALFAIVGGVFFYLMFTVALDVRMPSGVLLPWL